MNLIDSDVHVYWKAPGEIARYLDETWRHRWHHGGGHTASGLRLCPKYYDPDVGAGYGPARAVTDAETLEAGWRAPHRFDAVILSVYDAPLLSTFGDVDYPVAVATAVNRWLEEAFLSRNPRFHGSITVATQDPAAAAREIRRAAQNPQMVQVVLPAGTRLPYGHRVYHPIFEAAAECGLAVAIAAGTEGLGTSHPPTPDGWPGTMAEMTVAVATNYLCQITSLITEGVFARWPQLRIIGQETGVAWLPPYVWRFEKNFKALRSECPWVRDLPGEMVSRHFRFTSQGAGPAEPPEALWRLLDSVPDARSLLLYSGNHPRHDCEPPESSFALTTCPEAWRGAIAAENALATFPRLVKGS